MFNIQPNLGNRKHGIAQNKLQPYPYQINNKNMCMKKRNCNLLLHFTFVILHGESFGFFSCWIHIELDFVCITIRTEIREEMLNLKCDDTFSSLCTQHWFFPLFVFVLSSLALSCILNSSVILLSHCIYCIMQEEIQPSQISKGRPDYKRFADFGSADREKILF